MSAAHVTEAEESDLAPSPALFDIQPTATAQPSPPPPPKPPVPEVVITRQEPPSDPITTYDSPDAGSIELVIIDETPDAPARKEQPQPQPQPMTDRMPSIGSVGNARLPAPERGCPKPAGGTIFVTRNYNAPKTASKAHEVLRLRENGVWIHRRYQQRTTGCISLARAQKLKSLANKARVSSRRPRHPCRGMPSQATELVLPKGKLRWTSPCGGREPSRSALAVTETFYKYKKKPPPRTDLPFQMPRIRARKGQCKNRSRERLFRLYIETPTFRGRTKSNYLMITDTGSVSHSGTRDDTCISAAQLRKLKYRVKRVKLTRKRTELPCQQANTGQVTLILPRGKVSWSVACGTQEIHWTVRKLLETVRGFR